MYYGKLAGLALDLKTACQPPAGFLCGFPSAQVIDSNLSPSVMQNVAP